MALAYPWFLLGLLAIAVPIVIHLLQLRRPRRVLFTNTSFIREVELVTVSHRRLQNLLVLILRVLAIAALVLVFCQPFLPAKEGTGVTAESGLDVLVDNSFSMQSSGATGRMLYDDAVSQALELGRAVPQNARLRLVGEGESAMSKAVYLSKLEELRLSSSGANLNQIDFATGSSNPLYVLSDFQKTSFKSDKLAEWQGTRQVVLVPLAGKKTGNLYVDSVWLDDAFVRPRTNLSLHVRVQNGGQEPVIDGSVKVFLGPKQAASFRVTVEGGKGATTLVQVQVPDGNVALGRVVTEDVPVTFDNAYYFTLKPATAIRVLEISEKPVTQQAYGNEPLFSYSFAKPQRVDFSVLRQANLVLVGEATELDAGLREGLRAVVQRGGTVVIVPAAAASAQNSYQQLFKGLGLGTAQWENQVATPELREVAMPNAREPFFRDVFGAQQRAVTMPKVAPVLRWSRTGQDILRLRDGESYLAGFVSGNGRVYVFSAPFSASYSDFVEHALFVPVLYRLAMLSYRDEQLPAYRLNQGTVVLQLQAQGASATGARGDEAGFRFVKDSLTLIPAQRVSGSEVRLDVPEGMQVPGFYQVQRQGKVLTTVAFNMNKQESNLAAYSADELRAMIGPNRPNIRVVERGLDSRGVAEFRAEQKGQPLWRYFLVLVLVCLLAEAAVLRFGNRAVKKAARVGVPA